ncbi:hypothetical protein HK100_012317 [Physocladia obscura]|uniref:BZIP domain-containing protein n=1 Tax=Physocladia obscura TaxID=109957 RepID=A0AAD5T941_9FUNG|nr:hypothetical protein HK100_012317 [Physocladia obscura]
MNFAPLPIPVMLPTTAVTKVAKSGTPGSKKKTADYKTVPMAGKRHRSQDYDVAEDASDNDNDNDSNDLSVAPPGIDAELYALALATSKGKRSPELRDIIRQARVVRNRIAAQTSRDKKRRCFESLEAENSILKTRLAAVEALNANLFLQLKSVKSSFESVPPHHSHPNADSQLDALFLLLNNNNNNNDGNNEKSVSSGNILPSPSISHHDVSSSIFSSPDASPLIPSICEPSSTSISSLLLPTSIHLGQGEPAAL